MMIELMVIQGVQTFYDLNEQCKAQEIAGLLPLGTTEVYREKVQWTTRYINTKRLEYASRLVNRDCV